METAGVISTQSRLDEDGVLLDNGGAWVWAIPDLYSCHHSTQRTIHQLLLDVLAEHALFDNVGLEVDGE